MDMPKPGPAQERLKIFVGDWRGEEKMQPTPWLPEGGVRDAAISNRLGLDGFAIIQDYVQSNKGAPTFIGHAVILQRPQAETYQMYWFDSFAPSVFEGEWDGARGSFISDSAMGKTRASFDFTKPGAYTFRMEMSPDGKNFAPLMDGAYVKV